MMSSQVRWMRDAQETQPVIATMCVLSAPAAATLEHDLYHIENHPMIRKVVVDRQSGAVVVHSTHEFARMHPDIRAKKSVISKYAGQSDAESEGTVASAMLHAFADAFSLPAALVEPQWGPFAHRWGAAFPSSTGLSQAFHPTMNLAFAGDFAAQCDASNYVQTAGQSGCDAAGQILDS